MYKSMTDRELDIAVAGKVFGVKNPDTRWSSSINISDAWEVVGGRLKVMLSFKRECMEITSSLH